MSTAPGCLSLAWTNDRSGCQRQPQIRGRPRKHGGELALADPVTWPDAQVTTSTRTSRYGLAVAAAWDRVHSRLTHRAAWLDHGGPLPVIDGTLIRLQVNHLPGDRDPKPVWLWCSVTGAGPAEMDGFWQAGLGQAGNVAAGTPSAGQASGSVTTSPEWVADIQSLVAAVGMVVRSGMSNTALRSIRSATGMS